MELTLNEIGILLLICAGIILLISLVILIKNLLKSVKISNLILEDVETITDIAEKRAKEIDEIVDNVSDSLEEASKALKGHQSILKQLSSIAGAVTSVVGIFKKKEKSEEENK